MNLQRIFLFLIVSMHIAGVIGMQSPWKWLFQLVTPLHILAMVVILVWPRQTDRRYLTAVGTVAIITWLIEAVGVNTGWIFGSYTYGHTLGLQCFGTPLVIGANWVLLSFSIGHLLAEVSEQPLIKSAIASTLMVGVDVLIEPVAMAYDFWDWAAHMVPHQNYLGWWLVSFLLFNGLFRWVRFDPNRYASWILVAQVLFFLVLGWRLYAFWGP